MGTFGSDADGAQDPPWSVGLNGQHSLGNMSSTEDGGQSPQPGSGERFSACRGRLGHSSRPGSVTAYWQERAVLQEPSLFAGEPPSFKLTFTTLEGGKDSINCSWEEDSANTALTQAKWPGKGCPLRASILVPTPASEVLGEQQRLSLSWGSMGGCHPGPIHTQAPKLSLKHQGSGFTQESTSCPPCLLSPAQVGLELHPTRRGEPLTGCVSSSQTRGRTLGFQAQLCHWFHLNGKTTLDAGGSGELRSRLSKEPRARCPVPRASLTAELSTCSLAAWHNNDFQAKNFPPEFFFILILLLC